MHLSWLADSSSNESTRQIVNRYRTRPEIQLFDLNADPEEMNNLAENPKYKAKVNAMKAKLTAWMDMKNDDRGENYMIDFATLTAPKLNNYAL